MTMIASMFFTGCVTHKDWDECTKSSCWFGNNAEVRIMNVLSPNLTDQQFKDFVKMSADRGVNCFHLILANKADGFGAPYSIYGPTFIYGTVNPGMANKMFERVKYLYEKGYGVVLWLITDDSNAWAKSIAAAPTVYVNDLDRLGFFKYASTVVTGLEADEYWSAAQAMAMYNATKTKYSGKVGIHQTSGKYTLAGACDVFFAQVNPGTSVASIQAFVQKVKAATGKPVNMFEMERHEDRARCEAAFQAGAFGVGNW